MRADLERRLERLEGNAAAHPSRAEVWFCDDDMCRNDMTGETISHAELDARPDDPGVLVLAFVADDFSVEGGR